MALHMKNIRDIAVISVPGPRLDANNSKEFKSVVAETLRGYHRVLFDMSQLNFVDSSGLGALVSCLRQVNAAGGDLKLCGMTKPVRTLFELVRMHRVFDIRNTEEEALQAFQQ